MFLFVTDKATTWIYTYRHTLSLHDALPIVRVWRTSTTEQGTVIAVQGPNARAVIAPLSEGLDVSADAFPHMSIADAHICGVPRRLMRVSFTGELGFEVNVPSGSGAMVWQAIWERGRAYAIVP